MHDGALLKIAELSADTRHAVENILNRRLQDDEAIAITVYKPAPTGAARDEATRRLRERIDRTGRMAQGAPEAEVDAIIDEAVEHVRQQPE